MKVIVEDGKTVTNYMEMMMTSYMGSIIKKSDL